MDNSPETTANVNNQLDLAFEITSVTVFDTTNASIFFPLTAKSDTEWRNKKNNMR